MTNPVALNFPPVSLTDTVVVTYGDQTSYRVPVSAIPSQAGTVTSIATGNGLLGGPITAAGTISIDTSVVVTKTGTQTLSGNYTFSGGFVAPVFTNTIPGIVPVSPGGTTTYLRADGTWATPPGATSGTVTAITAGTGLTGGTISTSGTIAVNTGVIAALGNVNTWSSAQTFSVPIAVSSGGTGSASQNFVDLTTTQATIAGVKTFTGQLIGKGTATNDSAAAGYIGEYISSTVLSGAGVSLTSVAAANVTSISLSAGDWDVWGSVGFTPAGSTVTTNQGGWISTTSATLPTVPNGGAEVFNAPIQTAGAASNLLPVGLMRLNISGTTTVYLSAFAQFSVSTETAYGFIGARRVR